MNKIDEIKKPILAEMLEFDNIYHEVLDNDNPLLKTIHEYIMDGKGKKIRPILTLLSAKALGKTNKATLYAAFSIELLHTASLVHDDVIDDTLERRGKPSVNARWSNKITILSGDYLLSKSLNSAFKTENLDIMGTISNVGMMLTDGELLQLANRRQSLMTEEEYYKIIRRKTAELFAACTYAGASSVGGTDAQCESLKKFGEYLGMSFQIKDDIFDYYEDASIGKPTGNDVRDGKLTLPLIYALKNSLEEDKSEIVRLIDEKQFSDDNIHKITMFAHQYGGVEYAEKVMGDYKQKALDELNSIPASEAKKALQDCLDFVLYRKN